MSRTIGAVLCAVVLLVVAGAGSGWPSPAGAAVEEIYTLPFEGQYSVGTWFCGYSGHEGTDYILGESASGGHPVLAAARGTVWLYEQFPSGAGYYIVMNHGNGHRTRYLHLSSRVVTNGQVVSRGQVIGHAGGTGGVAPHLHFDLKLDSQAIRPEPMSGIIGFG